jgi:hypothetical protein
VDSGRDWSAEIETLIGQLTRYYVFPDVAEQVCQVLGRRLAGGAYRDLANEEALAGVVTEDMQSVNGDRHLFVAHRVQEIPQRSDPVVPDAGHDPRQAELAGHGFAKVERLPGNVGLLDIRRFY